MNRVRVRDLGRSDYEPVFAAMKTFTQERDQSTADEIWFTEHEPVFTQGQAGKVEHVLAPGDIPVVQSDRGGQVTYHGPGQITGYLMFNLRRLGIGVRDLVTNIELAMIDTLALYGIEAAARADAPGVYVGGDKIGSLGLRVRRGCAYHGLSLNVAMDLEPFSRINPCGLFGVQVTHMQAFAEVELPVVQQQLLDALCKHYDLTIDNDTPHVA
ncbi:MAG: lipoyl(octanoyl) transferase LipB [Pseudomonadota bacterium]